MRHILPSFVRGFVLGSLLLATGLVASSIYEYATFAVDESQEKNSVPSLDPPSFPKCVNQNENGDWAHYDYGLHQIVGNGLVEGADDVYSLDGGNYLQCLCDLNDNGTETIWWRVDELSQADINYFTSNGYYYLNGEQWNLGDYMYLAKNGEYLCSDPTPTPTPTVTPTPTPTDIPTPTPTPNDDEPESRCSGLSASPSSGTAPLTVRFTGSGYDEDGEIKLYKFDFGDASDDQPQVWEQEESEAHHRYIYEGTYFASLHVKDSRGNWRNGNDDCKLEIEVSDEPKVLGASTTTELPKTGAGAVVVGILSLSSLGAYLYRRFSIV
jgi:hypothetical protein